MSDKEAVELLIAHRIRFMDDFGWDKSTVEALDIAIASLATESKPVARAKWKFDVPHRFYDIVYCSACGEASGIMTNFCPNCGAAMNEEALRIIAERNKWGDGEGEE